MQALFYIGLFGTFFFVASSITVGLSFSAIQEQVTDRIEMARMFDEVANTINQVVLRQTPSLEMYLGEINPTDGEVTGTDLLFTAGSVSWEVDELQTDPWRSPIRVVRIRQEELVDGGGVFADVSYFVLASAGVDRTLQTTLPTTVTEWRDLHSTGGDEEDIVHTFSTRDAAVEIWNRASQTELLIRDVARRSYQQKVEQFNRDGNNALGNFTTCALFGVTDASSLAGVDCSPFTAALITECFAVHRYNNPPDGEDPGAPPAVNFLPSVDVFVNECWRYEPLLQQNASFPAMAGTINLYENPDDAGIVAALGVFDAIANDPFTTPNTPTGNITFEVGGNPSELVLRRGLFVDVPGWRFSGRQTLISAE